MDYKSVFTNLCLELQQNKSWIKGLGKNPFAHSIPFTHSLTAVPFVQGHRSVFPRTPRNTGVYAVIQCLSQKQNACLHAVRHAVEKEAKGLIVHFWLLIKFNPLGTVDGYGWRLRLTAIAAAWEMPLGQCIAVYRQDASDVYSRIVHTCTCAHVHMHYA